MWALRSTSIWGAVIVGIVGVVRVVKPEWADACDAVIALGAALGIVGLRRKQERG